MNMLKNIVSEYVSFGLTSAATFALLREAYSRAVDSDHQALEDGDHAVQWDSEVKALWAAEVAIQSRLRAMEGRVQNLLKRIAAEEAALRETTSPRRISSVQGRIAHLRRQLDSARKAETEATERWREHYRKTDEVEARIRGPYQDLANEYWIESRRIEAEIQEREEENRILSRFN